MGPMMPHSGGPFPLAFCYARPMRVPTLVGVFILAACHPKDPPPDAIPPSAPDFASSMVGSADAEDEAFEDRGGFGNNDAAAAAFDAASKHEGDPADDASDADKDQDAEAGGAGDEGEADADEEKGKEAKSKEAKGKEAKGKEAKGKETKEAQGKGAKKPDAKGKGAAKESAGG
jgi:hypothetical protein